MNQKSKLAIVSLILGICSFIQLLGIEKAVLAIIFGKMALKEINQAQLTGKKNAYAGIVLGSIYIFIVLVMMFVKGPYIMSFLTRR